MLAILNRRGWIRTDHRIAGRRLGRHGQIPYRQGNERQRNYSFAEHSLAFASLLLCVFAFTGCTLVPCNHTFPKLEWYWSAEAKACRQMHKQESAKPPTAAPSTNAPIEMPVSHSTAELIAPTQLLITWNPGGFSNFVLVANGDLLTPLAQWPAVLSTDQTNVSVSANQPAQFFALYGTNADGCSAWATK